LNRYGAIVGQQVLRLTDLCVLGIKKPCRMAGLEKENGQLLFQNLGAFQAGRCLFDGRFAVALSLGFH